jgi:two-component system NarL family response regulator
MVERQLNSFARTGRLGVEVIKRIRLESPMARIIVLTTFEDDEDLPCALEAGAQTYLLNGMTADELVATIRAVHAGRLRTVTPDELGSRLHYSTRERSRI